MAVETTAAPAPTPTISAESEAASRGDFGAFADAHFKGLSTLTKPQVEAPALVEPAAPVVEADATAEAEDAPEPKLTRKQREAQQEERTRQAVERATAGLQQQMAELRAQARAPEASAAAVMPDYKRYAQMAAYPKLAEYDSIEEHAAAVSLFVQDARAAEFRASQAMTERQTSAQAQVAAFRERITPALADPEFQAAFAAVPQLRDATPLSLLPPGSPSTFANVAAEAVLQSEQPAAFYRHLAAHPDDVARIGALPPGQWLPALSRLDGRLSSPPPAAPAAAAAPVRPSPVSSAPPPPPKVGKTGGNADPKAAALARGDVGAFAALDLQDRLRQRGRI